MDLEQARRRWWEGPTQPPHTRPVPRQSGEAAIYSIEYLTRKEGNAKGTVPYLWRTIA